MSTGDGPLAPGRRRARTRGAIDRLCRQTDDWLSAWKGRPEHDSQLQSLDALLRALIARLQTSVEATAEDATAYPACNRIDADLAFVERLWRYYKERLDQRRASAATASVLQAADDVIWSSYALARSLGPTEPPLPLAFLEPAYSATSLPRSKPPRGLRPTDRALLELVEQLPIPLVGLPTWVTDEPWWLAVIPHEAGHHAQYDLEPDHGLVGKVAGLLDRHGGEAWQAWRFEVFADAFAIAAIGPIANEVVAVLEWDDLDAMARPRGAYPPVILRLALGAELARALGHPAPVYDAAYWRPLLDRLTSAQAHAQMDDGLRKIAGASGLAAALATLVVGASSFAAAGDRATADDLGGNDAAAFAAVLAGGRRDLTRSRRKVRFAAASAFHAFRALPVADDAALARLQTTTLGLAAALHDDTTKRATVTPKATAIAALAGEVLERAEAARREELA